MPEPAELWLEDLREGQRFVSDALTVTAEMIKEFAARYDPQPFHLDEAAAEASVFGGLAASGWHTAALTMRLLVAGGGLPVAGGVIGAGGELSWPRPTRPGDRLHVVSTIERITPSRSKPDRGMLLVRSETLNQRAETAQLFIVNVLAFRRP